MFYFLAIVLKNDVKSGNITPSYILCNPNRRRRKKQYEKMDKEQLILCSVDGIGSQLKPIIFGDFHFHERQIEFVSTSNAIDRKVFLASKNKSSQYLAEKIVKPVGSIFWFQCDKRGRQLGTALYVKDVGDVEPPYETSDMHIDVFSVSRRRYYKDPSLVSNHERINKQDLNNECISPIFQSDKYCVGLRTTDTKYADGEKQKWMMSKPKEKKNE